MSAPAGVPATPVSVVGGAGGIAANREGIEHLAALHRRAAHTLGSDAFALLLEAERLGPFGGDPGAAGRTDLAGLATAHGTLERAIARLGRAAHLAEDLGTRLGNAAQGYPWGSDALDAGVLDTIRSLVGGATHALGSVHHGDTVAGLDPRSLDLLVTLVGVPQLTSLDATDDDGLGTAEPAGRAPVTPPRSLRDLVTGLGDVDRDGTPGGIDVRVLNGPDGRRHVVVDITGTRTWRRGGRNVADLGTNEHALLGDTTAYSQGVLAALRRAGVRRDDDVMLVGHSQGGLVAVTTARDAARTGEFRVTHVVTAGSPIGLTVGRLPASVRVLALENSADAVPRLDSAANPDRRNVTTVSSSHGAGSVGGNHGITTSYVAVATDAQHSESRSVRDFLASASGFFTATHGAQYRYRVERR